MESSLGTSAGHTAAQPATQGATAGQENGVQEYRNSTSAGSYTSNSDIAQDNNVSPSNGGHSQETTDSSHKHGGDDSSKPPAAKRSRRRKVDHACIYCRRSHMTCDEGRPCSRCIRRNIGHLCRDEPKKKGSAPANTKPGVKDEGNWATDSGKNEPVPTSTHQPTAMVLTAQNGQGNVYGHGPNNMIYQELGKEPEVPKDPVMQFPKPIEDVVQVQRSPFNDWSSLGNQSVLAQTSEFNQNLFFSEHANSEFASLGDFLTMIEDPNANTDMLIQVPPPPPGIASAGPLSSNVSPGLSRKSSGTELVKQVDYEPAEPQVSDSARDKFFLTAADPSVDVSPEERLKQVIRAKVEAGLLQPFNYARGYARLQKYMDNYMNQSSKQRILKPLSIFRPAFRAIAQSLMDIDLVLVEESFERMLLDYDRVFTSMAIPACLWRRTGEIYRGNKEFAGLVEVSVDNLRDGQLAIYELMSEESAVNYWEKYGNIAFDSGQKAVLTSCNLRTKDRRKRRACCFSFTIQRDRYNIPSCIIGNFIPIHP